MPRIDFKTIQTICFFDPIRGAMMEYISRSLYWLAAGLSVLLAGCASFDMTRPPPAQSQPISISFAHDELLGWTDFPPGVYRVPDSQVIMSGHQKGGAIGGALFGALGFMAQNAINSSREASATQSIKDVLTFSMTSEAERISHRLIAAEAFKNRFSENRNANQPQLRVATLLVLTYVDQTRATSSIILKASLSMPDRADSVWTTRYIASTGEPRLLLGPDSWTANNGEELKKSVSINMEKAIRFMLADIASPFVRDDSRQVMVQGGFPYIPQRLQLVGRQLAEDADTLVIQPRLGDGVAFSGVSILDKSSITFRPAKIDDERFKLIEDPASKSGAR